MFHFSSPSLRRAFGAALIVALGVMSASSAHAETPSSGNISREVGKTLPFIQSETAEPSKKAARIGETAAGEKKERLVEDPAKSQAEETIRATPIKKIVLSTAVLKKQITTLLEDPALNRNLIEQKDLIVLRQRIWALGVQNKRLLHVNFRFVPNPNDEQSRWLMIDVLEIAVRHVSVEAETGVRQGIIDDIRKEAERQFVGEKVLDLNELDTNIKKRLRLGDVLLHTSVLPVDETHVDLKISVKSVPTVQTSLLVQYDNAGGWSFGRDRLIGGLAVHGLFPGDQLSLMAMKTADAGNGDASDGIYFGRAEYQVPIGELGIKLDTWASGLHYHEIEDVASHTQTNGEALEFGQGVIRPIYLDSQSAMEVHADFFARYTVDRALETERTAEKAEYAGRIRGIYTHAFKNNDLVILNLGIVAGDVDLSGHRGAYAQDQAGPKVNGTFSKVEAESSWNGAFGKDNKIDFRAGLKGQWAANNLDSVEKFSLGGSSGLRAFGSGEASGDMGVMINGDLGYTFENGIRPFALYDAGTIWKSVDPWVGEGGPQNYFLHNVGVGVSTSFNPIDLSVTFAHQIGPNPGQSAQGLDVDNSKQHYRVWASLAYRY